MIDCVANVETVWIFFSWTLAILLITGKHCSGIDVLLFLPAEPRPVTYKWPLQQSS